MRGSFSSMLSRLGHVFFTCSSAQKPLTSCLALSHYLWWTLSCVCLWRGERERERRKEAACPSSTWQGDVAKPWRQTQSLAGRQPQREKVRDRGEGGGGGGGGCFIFFSVSFDIWEKAFRRGRDKSIWKLKHAYQDQYLEVYLWIHTEYYWEPT